MDKYTIVIDKSIGISGEEFATEWNEKYCNFSFASVENNECTEDYGLMPDDIKVILDVAASSLAFGAGVIGLIECIIKSKTHSEIETKKELQDTFTIIFVQKRNLRKRKLRKKNIRNKLYTFSARNV